MGAKLTYIYGAMNSGKSTKLLQTAYNYESQGHQVHILKPKIDSKGDDKVVSRLGLSKECTFLIDEEADQSLYYFYSQLRMNRLLPKVILVDEAQFLSEDMVEQLAEIVDDLSVDVICYGIKLDFQGNLFEGSKALLKRADVLREEISICKCGKRTTENLRYNTKTQEYILAGDQVAIDGESDSYIYISMCRKCAREIRKELGE